LLNFLTSVTTSDSTYKQPKNHDHIHLPNSYGAIDKFCNQTKKESFWIILFFVAESKNKMNAGFTKKFFKIILEFISLEN
jgi:hypothetical protein